MASKQSLGFDTIKQSKKELDERQRGLEVLMHAQSCYTAMEVFRRARERCKRYTYGDQWSDIVCDNGIAKTEAQYIKDQGQIPLTQNLIRRLVRNVIGVMRSQESEPTCVARDRDEQSVAETMNTALQYNMQLNRMNELTARTMEEYLISGMAVFRKWAGYRGGKLDCWTDYVQPNNFFIDPTMRDFRGLDCNIVGEIHDVSFQDVCMEFAKTPAQYQKLADIYREARDTGALAQTWSYFGYPWRGDWASDFLSPRDPAKCRVIEVWRKETKPRWRCHDRLTGEVYKVEESDYKELVIEENAKRTAQAIEAGAEPVTISAEWFVDSYWYFYCLAPTGEILAEGETPYDHGESPYVWKAYPMIDGEIHSFVADVIDQQRYVNRLITTHDWIMKASAKGVLLIPEDCIPKGCTPQMFADAWTKYNGCIVYTPSKTGQIPHQVVANSTQIGISELLNLQLKFFEDISGVNGALQGKQEYAGQSAAMFNQQTVNATNSLLDILDSFQEFLRDSAYKDVKNIQQFYDEKRMLNIVGREGSLVEYDPDQIRDVEFDLSINQSQSSPVYRQIANDFLMQMMNQGQITIGEMLECGHFPFGDKLLQAVNQRQQQQAQMQAQQGMMPEQGAYG